mmetsp:Transcript_18682/g.60959  ORF Transcript_18682/g.60959 Transcript_18682/m.60959 type:complete len:331 (-) Transcript_18682:549-1541(-)
MTCERWRSSEQTMPALCSERSNAPGEETRTRSSSPASVPSERWRRSRRKRRVRSPAEADPPFFFFWPSLPLTPRTSVVPPPLRARSTSSSRRRAAERAWKMTSAPPAPESTMNSSSCSNDAPASAAPCSSSPPTRSIGKRARTCGTFATIWIGCQQHSFGASKKRGWCRRSSLPFCGISTTTWRNTSKPTIPITSLFVPETTPLSSISINSGLKRVSGPSVSSSQRRKREGTFPPTPETCNSPKEPIPSAFAALPVMTRPLAPVSRMNAPLYCPSRSGLTRMCPLPVRSISTEAVPSTAIAAPGRLPGAVAGSPLSSSGSVGPIRPPSTT